jgi:hypothetical protein
MTERDCLALLAVIQTFLVWRSQHQPQDLADLFDLLGRLETEKKRAFWAWLATYAPIVKKWLMAKGSSARRAA